MKEKINDFINEKMGKSNLSLYLGSALAGLVRTTVGFPIEHPLDSIKTQWQAKPYIKNEIVMVREIYNTKGVWNGLYAGSLPNLTRCILKNTYRYPLMVGLPAFYSDTVPS